MAASSSGCGSTSRTGAALEIWVTGVELRAVLEEQTVSLSDILRLEVGSTLRLSAGIDPRVLLRCGQVAMAHGRIGRAGDRLVIKVEDTIERDGSRA